MRIKRIRAAVLFAQVALAIAVGNFLSGKVGYPQGVLLLALLAACGLSAYFLASDIRQTKVRPAHVFVGIEVLLVVAIWILAPSFNRS